MSAREFAVTLNLTMKDRATEDVIPTARGQYDTEWVGDVITFFTARVMEADAVTVEAVEAVAADFTAGVLDTRFWTAFVLNAASEATRATAAEDAGADATAADVVKWVAQDVTAAVAAAGVRAAREVLA